ncbi:hypothetical protein [Nakamurella deserti]|uniref:hypothetical protein n=1 Tax=Nakamurella deserti TaxID=2164074 RepID=UPI000DBEA735|nr:hypothetical protein [Nakamurella deserti]
MARSTLLIGSVLATALLVGCSGTSNDGNASATNTTPTSSSTAAPSSTGSTSGSTSTSASTTTSEDTATTTDDETTSTDEETATGDAGDDSTGSVQPASLDEQSKAWFGTFCTGMTGAFGGMMGAMSGAMSTESAADPKATQAALVAAYQQIGTSFSDTASALDGLPVPTVENGDALAGDLIGALNALGEGYSTATEKFAAAEVTDEASLSAAMDAFTAETEEYGQQLETEFGDLENTMTPEIGAAVEALPECQMMAS